VQPPGHESERPQGFPVEPLGVVDHDQARRLGEQGQRGEADQVEVGRRPVGEAAGHLESGPLSGGQAVAAGE